MTVAYSDVFSFSCRVIVIIAAGVVLIVLMIEFGLAKFERDSEPIRRISAEVDSMTEGVVIVCDGRRLPVHEWIDVCLIVGVRVCDPVLDDELFRVPGALEDGEERLQEAPDEPRGDGVGVRLREGQYVPDGLLEHAPQQKRRLVLKSSRFVAASAAVPGPRGRVAGVGALQAHLPRRRVRYVVPPFVGGNSICSIVIMRAAGVLVAAGVPRAAKNGATSPPKRGRDDKGRGGRHRHGEAQIERNGINSCGRRRRYVYMRRKFGGRRKGASSCAHSRLGS